MLEIDGGDGGGQILRTALALSMVTDTPVEITDIRGSRPTPGLRPQHLAGVRVAEAVSDADVSGATVGATDLTFVPDEVTGGNHSYDIGTAGSITLLFETLLPLATTLDDPLTVTATGGTDVKWAPTMAYYEHVKLPLLRRYGLDAGVTVHRSGFYPAGGGRATLRLTPSSLSTIDLTERGSLDRILVHSKASTSLENKSVAVRQAEAAGKRLAAHGVDYGVDQPVYVPTTSPGSALLLEARYEASLVGFDALGERGKSSEQVADEAADAFEMFADSTAAVDEHLADQVMLFLALAGGEVRIPRVTAHVRTNLEVIRAFGLDLSLTEASDGTALLDAPGRGD